MTEDGRTALARRGAADPAEQAEAERDPVRFAVALERRADDYEAEGALLREAAAEILGECRAARTAAAECRSWARQILQAHRRGLARQQPARRDGYHRSASAPIAAAAARTRAEDVAPRGGRPAPGSSRWDRARRAGVPYATQQALDDLARRAPDLLERVAEGHMPLDQAIVEAGLRRGASAAAADRPAAT